jgi:hypothetical protein
MGKVTVDPVPDEPAAGCERLVTVVADDPKTVRQLLATATGATEAAAGSW